MMRRKAMTLAEVLTGLMILAVLAGVMTLNSNTIGQQTARREADRVAAFFRAHLQRANMTHDVLWFTVSIAGTPNTIEARTGTDFDAPMKKDTLEAREKCLFTGSSLYLVYNTEKQQVVHMNTYKLIPANASVDIGSETIGLYCITVTGADGKSCFVRISK